MIKFDTSVVMAEATIQINCGAQILLYYIK